MKLGLLAINQGKVDPAGLRINKITAMLACRHKILLSLFMSKDENLEINLSYISFYSKIKICAFHLNFSSKIAKATRVISNTYFFLWQVHYGSTNHLHSHIRQAPQPYLHPEGDGLKVLETSSYIKTQQLPKKKSWHMQAKRIFCAIPERLCHYIGCVSSCLWRRCLLFRLLKHLIATNNRPLQGMITSDRLNGL